MKKVARKVGAAVGDKVGHKHFCVVVAVSVRNDNAGVDWRCTRRDGESQKYHFRGKKVGGI